MTTFAHRKYYSGTEHFTPDFELKISMGEIPGAGFVHKFGLDLNVGAAFETCWTMSTAYAYLSTETALNISSGDVDDTSAGVGAQQISIEGLDGGFNKIEEEVLLNGQTAVATKKKYLRVHRMKVIRGLPNEGIIYAGIGGPASGVPTTTYGAIAIGYGQTLQAFYTIPSSHVGFLYSIDAKSGIAKNGLARLMVREEGGVFQVKDIQTFVDSQATSEWRYPLEIPAKSDVELQLAADGAGGSMAASFTILLIRD